MSHKIIKVLAARSQEQLENDGADVEQEFDTLKDARERAKYYLSETFRLTSEASERLGYSQVLVNDECVNDYFGERV